MDYLIGKSEFKNQKNALDEYIRQQELLVITNAIKNNIDEFTILGLNDTNIDEFINLFRFDANVVTPQVFWNMVDKYLQQFDMQKRKQIKGLVSKVLKELVNNQQNMRTYHYLMSSAEKEKYSINDYTNTPQYYMCPVYGQISAGQPNWAEECIEGRIPIDPNLMNIVNAEEHFFLRVNGESMNKIIKNGAYALIHKQDIVEDGEIAVVLVNGYDATLKKFTRQGDLIILEPDSNDSSFKTQAYDKNTSIKILGKYIGKMEFN